MLDDIGFEGIMYNLQPAGFGMRVVGEALTVQETTDLLVHLKLKILKWVT